MAKASGFQGAEGDARGRGIEGARLFFHEYSSRVFAERVWVGLHSLILAPRSRPGRLRQPQALLKPAASQKGEWAGLVPLPPTQVGGKR